MMVPGETARKTRAPLDPASTGTSVGDEDATGSETPSAPEPVDATAVIIASTDIRDALIVNVTSFENRVKSFLAPRKVTEDTDAETFLWKRKVAASAEADVIPLVKKYARRAYRRHPDDDLEDGALVEMDPVVQDRLQATIDKLKGASDKFQERIEQLQSEIDDLRKSKARLDQSHEAMKEVFDLLTSSVVLETKIVG